MLLSAHPSGSQESLGTTSHSMVIFDYNRGLSIKRFLSILVVIGHLISIDRAYPGESCSPTEHTTGYCVAHLVDTGFCTVVVDAPRSGCHRSRYDNRLSEVLEQ